MTWTGPNDTRVADAVAGLGSALRSVFTWDDPLQRFLSYFRSGPLVLNTATVLNYGDGVWLLMDAAATWEQPAP